MVLCIDCYWCMFGWIRQVWFTDPARSGW